MAEDKNNALYENYSQLSVEHLRAKQEELKISIKNCHVSLGTKIWNAAESLLFGTFFGSAVGGTIFGVANRNNIRPTELWRPDKGLFIGPPKQLIFSSAVTLAVTLGGFLSSYRRLNKFALIQDETNLVSRQSMIEQILRDKSVLEHASKKERVVESILSGGEAKGAQL